MDSKIIELLDKEDFSAINYINSLTADIDLNDNEVLVQNEKSLSNIVNNLDIYSTSCQIEINGKISDLNKVFESVSESNTKLQYYINSLLNIINNLIVNSDSKIKQFANNDAVITSLINLKKIENSLVQVDKLFQTSKFICTINNKEEEDSDNGLNGKAKENENSVVSLEGFKECLASLNDILIEQLKVNKSLINSSQSLKSLNSISSSNSVISNKIDSLSELKHLFTNINNFDEEYSKFIAGLTIERGIVEKAFAEKQKYFKDREEESKKQQQKKQTSADVNSKAKEPLVGNSATSSKSTNSSGTSNDSDTKKTSDAATKAKATESSGFGGWFNFSI